ncbi:hypothetical protein QQP08_005789 [Theobroma cacao]|nr:hypothetical protein QQP08_005789 [Theobroma cacao]
MSKQLVLLNSHPTLLNPAHSQFHLPHPIQEVPRHFENFVVFLLWCQLSCFILSRIPTPWFTLEFDEIQRYKSARSKTKAARVKAAQEA